MEYYFRKVWSKFNQEFILVTDGEHVIALFCMAQVKALVKESEETKES